MALTVLAGHAIKPRNPELDDIIEMLKSTGYELYSFDMEDLAKEKHKVRLSIRIYERDSLVMEDLLATYPMVFDTRTMMADLPEYFFSESEVHGEDLEAGVYKTVKKFNIGFYRQPNDTTAMLMIDIPNDRSSTLNLKLKPLEECDGLISYYSKPFRIEDSLPHDGSFIPLALYGSMWYDERFKIARFCGKYEVSFSDHDDITDNSPHYYVVGIQIDPK